MAKRICLIIMIIFYIGAGINHFIHPLNYLKIIPPYLPWPQAINYLSGAAEIAGGLLLIFLPTRKYGAYLIIMLLILFIPAHIYMIQTGWCLRTGFCFPQWVIWLRLFPIQFILIAWACWYRK